LTEAETERLLQVARDVAHGVERKITPLAAFLLGMRVQQRMQAGQARAEVIDASIADLRATLPAAAG
jgi:hypothetical protein